VVVKARDTHSQLLGKVLNPKRLVELVTEPFDRPRDAVAMAALDRNLTQSFALLTHQEPVHDLPRDQGQEKGRLVRGHRLAHSHTST
jgi:hypothetical protein